MPHEPFIGEGKAFPYFRLRFPIFPSLISQRSRAILRALGMFFKTWSGKQPLRSTVGIAELCRGLATTQTACFPQMDATRGVLKNIPIFQWAAHTCATHFP